MAYCRRYAPVEFAYYEATLVEHAKDLCFDDFRRVCAAWRDAVDATKEEKNGDRLYQRRHLVFHRRHDGSLVIQSGELDPVSAEAFLNELERLEHELFVSDWAEAKAEFGDNVTHAHLRRSPAQRRADALVEMAHRSRTAPADGQRPVPLVSVYVGYETVAGRLCELASGMQITTKQLLPIFTQADIERVVFGPRNRVIDLGVRARFFTGGLRRAIELRDRHCQFFDCDTPAAKCDVDHIVEYAEGGLTTQENGRLACPRHNQARNGTDPPDWDDGRYDAESEAEINELDQRCRARVRQLVRCRPDAA